MSFKHSKT